MRAPWKRFGPLEPDETYLVLASSIPVRRYRSTATLFRGSRLVKRQLAWTAGVKGFSLLARPFRKRYASLSVWAGENALATFVASEPHRTLMKELGPEMAPTTFARWTIQGRDGRPRWREALRRLEAAEQRDVTSTI